MTVVPLQDLSSTIAAGPRSSSRWRAARSCTTSARPRSSATGAAKRPVSCATRARKAAPVDGQLAAQICLRDAWPAPETADCDGWLLRAGQGGYNRANSRVDRPLHRRRGGARSAWPSSFYRRRGLRPRFQMTRHCRAGWSRRGTGPAWLPRGTGLLRHGQGASAARQCRPTSRCRRSRTADWLALYGAEQPPQKAAELPLILAKLPSRRAFILCRRERCTGGRRAGRSCRRRRRHRLRVDGTGVSAARRGARHAGGGRGMGGG